MYVSTGMGADGLCDNNTFCPALIDRESLAGMLPLLTDDFLILVADGNVAVWVLGSYSNEW